MSRNGTRRVVVTGMGALSALGNDVPSTWAGLIAGRSGVRRIELFDPSRPRSNGREAASGSSLRVERAFIELKPPTTASWIAASVPPASMMSASSRRIVSQASPIAWAPVAQAETVAKFGPSIPNAIATWPEPTFGMPIGMKNGLIRSGPRSAMSRTLSNIVATPPRPDPRMTPVRSASGPSIRPGRPAWSSASRATTSPNWM